MVSIKKIAPKSQEMPPYDPAAICDPPETLPYDDLFDPVMVTVILINDGEDDTKFNIPRALICGRSEYFKMAFMEHFAEAGQKEIWLEDVPVWLFKTFVKWLYTQRLTLHPVEASIPKCGEKRSREEDESEGDEQPKKKHRVAHGETGDLTVSTASAATKNVAPSAPRSLTVYGLDIVEPEADGTVPPRAPNAPDEEDPKNPITCSFRSLFELYVFSDKYDTFALRKLVLEHIQLKVAVHVPRMYLPPSKEDTKYAVERLPSENHLFKFLFELWAKDIMLSSTCASRIGAVQILEEFPKGFLAACLVSSKAQARAMYCGCGEDCHGVDHSSGDDIEVFENLECDYHEQ